MSFMVNCVSNPERKAGQRIEEGEEDSTALQSAGLAV